MIAAGPDRRAEMGRAGREKMAREFDQRLVIEAYQAAISGIAGAGATSLAR
jgi:hypothetical protein